MSAQNCDKSGNCGDVKFDLPVFNPNQLYSKSGIWNLVRQIQIGFESNGNSFFNRIEVWIQVWFDCIVVKTFKLISVKREPGFKKGILSIICRLEKKFMLHFDRFLCKWSLWHGRWNYSSNYSSIFNVEGKRDKLMLLSVGLILWFYGRNKAFNQISVIPKIYINNLSFFSKIDIRMNSILWNSSRWPQLEWPQIWVC